MFEPNLGRVLAAESFFSGMRPDHLDFIAGCAKNVRFRDGDMLFREGEEAVTFFLIREGQVSLEFKAAGHSRVVIQTAAAGEVVGWSWLVGSHLWRYSARAIGEVRALAFDGACLRGKCDQSPELGYEVLKRVANLIAHRLEATRLQLLDIYAAQG
jgi:CRP/FNR family cyclic AMP-dependent transcriptional regulator